MTRKILSLLVFQNNEKPQSYLKNYLGAIENWNLDAMDETEIIIISQKETTESAEEAARSVSFPVKIIDAGHPFVDGQPVWDVLASIRTAWPQVEGQYISVNHTEFIWCWGRLWNTTEYLKTERPYVALGNLMRPLEEDGTIEAGANCSKEISRQLSELLDAGRWNSKTARLAERLPSVHWQLWLKGKKPIDHIPGRVKWHEDIFFIDRDWLQTWDALQHGGEQPFQDIWDLWGQAIKFMGKYTLDPAVYRMPQLTNRVIHLWHPKGHEMWTASMRDWFLSNPTRWIGTKLLEESIWDRLLNAPDKKTFLQAKREMRWGAETSTTIRYLLDFISFLNGEGSHKLLDFYMKNGRDRRDVHAEY